MSDTLDKARMYAAAQFNLAPQIGDTKEIAAALLAAEAKCAAMEKVVEAAREVRETDKAWMAADAPEYGDLANAAANAHVRLDVALSLLADGQQLKAGEK